MTKRGILAIWFWMALVALPVYADQYRIIVRLDPGDDAAAVARRLAATYRGELERPVEVAGGTFSMSITMGPRQAELLARDPHVETVQTAAAVPLPSPAPRQPEALAVQSWSSGDYLYDGSGNIRRIGTDVYVYDGASRVVRADAGPTHRQQYAYDGFGNLHTVITDAPVNATDVSPYRSRIAINPETNRAEYPGTESGQPNPIDPLTTQPYTMAAQYDGSGRVTALIHKTDTFEYDALDMVKKAKVDGQWRAYVYNASNERIGTIGLSGQANGADTGSDWTLRDTGGQVLRRLSRSSTGVWSWKEDYIYRGSQLLAAEVTGPEKVRHFHLDHLGSPRLITGNGGVELPPEGAVPVSRPTYYAFGAQAGTATAGEKQFTGHERDSTSLDYMHARYYSPQMGRFLSVDPTAFWQLQVGSDADRARFRRYLRQPQRWNRYTYVVNNPLRYTDPDGREHVQEPGFTKPMTAENLAMDENTPAVIKGAFYAQGALLAAAGGYALYEAGSTAYVAYQAWRAASATAATIKVVQKISGGDARILQRAMDIARSSGNTFSNNINAIAEAVRQLIPGGRLTEVGRIGDQVVYGSANTRIGLAVIDGATMVVRFAQDGKKYDVLGLFR